MINFILDLLAAHAGEIGTALVTALIALLKRFLDKKKIRAGLLSRGVNADDVNAIV